MGPHVNLYLLLDTGSNSYGTRLSKIPIFVLIHSVRRIGGDPKKLLTIDERGSGKIARNRFFDCHLSPAGRQMDIENSVSNEF